MQLIVKLYYRRNVVNWCLVQFCIKLPYC